MSEEISVSASDRVSSIRAFPWPVLEMGNGSFENGKYSVICEDEDPGNSFWLNHKVQSRLIERWIEMGKLMFACAVAAPISMYRAMHVSTEPKQLIEWKQEDLGESPLFTPMILSKVEIQHVVDSKADGISQLWHGERLILPKGARVAICSTFGFQLGISGLLVFNRDKNLNRGQFRVVPSEDYGFRFQVHLAKDLFDYLHYYRRELTGRNVMTHIVSAALGHLRETYSQDDGEEGWRSHRNLVALANLLQSKGLEHWSDENFKPEFVATHLYPHRLPDEGDE